MAQPPPSILFAAHVSQEEPLELLRVDTAFAVNNVTLDADASAGRNTLMVSVGGRPYIAIANLHRDVCENASLALIFEAHARVCFAVKGDSTIHLAGSYMHDEEDEQAANEERELAEYDRLEQILHQQQQHEDDLIGDDDEDEDDDGGMFQQIMNEDPDEDDDDDDEPVVEVASKGKGKGKEAEKGDAASETKSMHVNGETLFYIDLSAGGGKHRVKPGSQVRIRYVGRLATNDRVFDASGKSCFNFQVGHGAVIPGLDHGVRGMKMGGRRKLFIPPDLAYGAVGVPPDIPGDSSLVFDVEFVAFGAGAGKKKRRNEKRQGSPPAFESAHTGASKRNRKRKKKKRKATESK